MPSPALFTFPSPMHATKQQRRGPHAEQGERIRRRRKEMRMSQATLGELYGSQQGYISDVERGWVNFSGSDLEWFTRMSAALGWNVETLMNELGIKYVKASALFVTNSTQELSIESAASGYAAVELPVTIDTESGGTVQQQKVVVIPQELASADSLAGYQISGTYLNAAVPGQIAIYIDVSPITDDVVVVRIGGRLAVAYYSEAGIVATDRPITPRTPLEFEPDAILGVVMTFTSAGKPRRPAAPN